MPPMRVEIPNSELTATLNAFSKLQVAPGATKLKVARLVTALLRATSTFDVEPFTEAELRELGNSPLEASLLAFLLPFVAPPTEGG